MASCPTAGSREALAHRSLRTSVEAATCDEGGFTCSGMYDIDSIYAQEYVQTSACSSYFLNAGILLSFIQRASVILCLQVPVNGRRYEFFHQFRQPGGEILFPQAR